MNRASSNERLAAIAQTCRHRYAERLAGVTAGRWWTAVVITASSQRQAERYRWEIHRRAEQGKLLAGATYLVVPDPQDQRTGTGGATLGALRVLVPRLQAAELAGWWAGQRVLMIHSGGDSRRLPQYSLSGKLFSALPVKTPWGEASTVFDETMALSTAWVEHMPAGLLIGSGDVVITFASSGVDWSRPGVSGIGIRQPSEVGTQHGVYIVDELGRVYAFLQKPSLAEVRAAGGLLEGDEVAVDSGLLGLDPQAAARLTEVAHLPGILGGMPPVIDLYEHVTRALTGQWMPRREDAAVYHRLLEALKGVPFGCSIVEGGFTHIGTTTLFRKLLTEQSEFSGLYAAQQQLGASAQSGLRCSGVVIDSVLAGGGQIGPGAVVIECNLGAPVYAARGSVLHGLESLPPPLEIPEDTVVHQVPVARPDGRRGTVIRVYGVADDPKLPAASCQATWFGRSMLEELRSFNMDLSQVWPGLPPEERTLWNARLFPMATVDEAWACARWLMHLANDYPVERWRRLERLSLASSTEWADGAATADALTRRAQANWHTAAVLLADSGSDIRPLLAHAPGLVPLAQAGQTLLKQGGGLESSAPTEAASRYYHASLFLAQAGLSQVAEQAREAAFRMVEQAVAGSSAEQTSVARQWRHNWVRVGAPARIDMGGGWSDTPPFCLDWGGTVLNIALQLKGDYPIRTDLRRLEEPLIRCESGEEGQTAEFREWSDILCAARPGDPFAVPRAALRMARLAGEEQPLAAVLERMGGGLEIRTAVNLPMGSGLGTSSILAATVMCALEDMLGGARDCQGLSDEVMRLEQLMTTGGGWQDQAGGIFPGAKLVTSGPGLRQRLRVQPVGWTPQREAEFEALMVLYYTGIRRIAKDLLRQVVGRYLARETATVQVLHSIKTLAVEMAHAMQDGEWDYLGELLDRHWQLNQVLDPNTTNAPINALLQKARPYLRGAKLAGAGGGGFLMLLARSAAAARELRETLAADAGQGTTYEWKIAKQGLCVERG